MFHFPFKDKHCVLQHDVTSGDEIFHSGDEFIMTGRVEMSINGKVGRIVAQCGIVPSKQRGDHRAEILVDVHDLVVYS